MWDPFFATKFPPQTVSYEAGAEFPSSRRGSSKLTRVRSQERCLKRKMLPDAYGCVVANRFGNLLDDDADPLSEVETRRRGREEEGRREDDRRRPFPDQRGGDGEGEEEEEEGRRGEERQAEETRAEGKSQKDPARPCRLRTGASLSDSDAPDPAPVRRQQQRVRPGPVTESGDGREEAQRGTKRAAFGDRRANQEEYPQEFSIPKPSYNADSDLRGRGGNRGRRGSRGGGGYTRNSDNFNLRGKREYDRHNGTGISPEEKRGGRGPWNWGCAEEAATASEVDVEMVVQVAMEMTLDEWKAMQEISRPKTEFNIRKAENKIPSKAKVIHQSKHLENLKVTPEDMEDDGNFLRRSVNDITSLLDINFGSLGRPTRGGRGRGARGGPTSRPERPKPIMEREEDPAPNPDDPEDFPALSAGR
ncbi:hypothetical protein L3Q82_023208 [Scortum barcoo]|uniref:Uncharacterized protein n=1 Tax=Scortum barcoo TaxID=214431 RepID=A0ACB8X1B6_9TELE|nr:hypothetical protein L3Q82_023208 [Scortum barcoo]